MFCNYFSFVAQVQPTHSFQSVSRRDGVSLPTYGAALTSAATLFDPIKSICQFVLFQLSAWMKPEIMSTEKSKYVPLVISLLVSLTDKVVPICSSSRWKETIKKTDMQKPKIDGLDCICSGKAKKFASNTQRLVILSTMRKLFACFIRTCDVCLCQT